MMRRFRALSRIGAISALLPVVAVAVLSMYRPAFLAGAERATSDALLRLARARPPDGRVAIVDIDERSLSAIGQWPWRRDVLGTLVSRVRSLGASAVAVDVLLAEAERTDGGNSSTDPQLAEMLRGGGVVLGFALTFDHADGPPPSCLQQPLGLAIASRGSEEEDPFFNPFFHATGAICSLPVLAQAAGASGFLNAAPDSDGILRRVPLLVQLGGRVYPGLALAAVATATGAQSDVRCASPTSNVVAVARRSAGAARRQEQSARPLSRRQADVPLRLGGRRDERPGRSRGAFATRSCSSARRRSARAKSWPRRSTRCLPASKCRRPLPTTCCARFLPASGTRRRRRDAGSPRDSAHWPSLLVVWPDSCAVRRLSACAASPRWTGAVALLSSTGALRLAALSDVEPGRHAGGDGRACSSMFERSRADRAVADKDVSQPPDGAVAAVADRNPGRRDRPALAPDPALHADARADSSSRRSEYRAISHAGSHRAPRQPGAAARHRQSRRAGSRPAQARRADRGRDRRDAQASRARPRRDRASRADVGMQRRPRRVLALAKDIVYTHHERWDGTGYPRGLARRRDSDCRAG